MSEAVATRTISTVKDLLRSPAAYKQIESVAASHLSGERMARIVANAARVTPQLYECEPMSLLGAMMTSASLGLEPNTPQGHAYLVPFNNRRKIDDRWETVKEATLIIGYKGFIDLAFRTGSLTYVDAGVHYSDDDLWRYEKGMDFTLRHAEGPQKGEKLHSYAIVKWATQSERDGFAAVVLPWTKVMSTRDGSQNWQSAERTGKTDKSPWTTNEDQMAMKTAIRALAQSGRMPMSVEMQTAVNIDSNDRVNLRDVVSNPELLSDGTAGLGAGGGDVLDGEAVETDESQEDPTPVEQAKEKPEPKPEEKKTRARARPRAKKTQGEPDMDLWKKHRAMGDEIIENLIDVGPDGAAKVMVAYTSEIKLMKAEAPDVYADVEKTSKELS